MARFEGTVAFLGSEILCQGTATFRFARPEGYEFLAGEYFRLTITTRDGEQTHSFSHADAPCEDAIMLLTRLTGSAFKDALLDMKPGDTARLSGPFGALMLGQGVERAGFLVGGVGVSPARSILTDLAATARPIDLFVFDGNQDEGCVPFREEFARIQSERATIHVVHVLAAPGQEWDGERGFITADTVRRHCDPLGGRHWYVCGPPAMVDAMRAVVDDLGIPEDLRHFEVFAGY